MKLNYREKLFLLVFSVIVIVIIFCAWPIRTFRQKIDSNSKVREDVLKEYKSTKNKIDEIPNLEKQIEQLYNESSEYSKIFIETKTNEEVDKYVADILNDATEYVCKNMKDNTVELYGIEKIQDIDQDELEFSYYAPIILDYPILQAADINGNLMETEDKELYDKCMNSTKIEALQTQMVEMHKQEINLVCTKTGLLKFLDRLAEIDSGIKVNEIKVDNPQFNFRENLEQAKDNFEVQRGFSKVTINITYYTMQKIAKPEFMK